MPKDHRLKTQKHSLPVTIPLNFLLGCSQQSLDQYELARLAESADLRKQFHVIFDRLIEQSALAMLAQWFRESDRDSINQALAIEESPTEWAKRQMKQGRRGAEDLDLPLPSLPVGSAHIAAALRYTERNIAEGKCGVCPQPLDPNSVRYCTKHLTAARHRMEKKGKAVPGSREYLYSEEKQPSTHGRQPGTLKALATANEQKQRAILAELGIPPESAALTLDAARQALMKLMPDSRNRARVAADLWHAALIPSLVTGKRAIKELLAEGVIQRVGEGNVGNPYRYFRAETPIAGTWVPGTRLNNSSAKRETSKDKNRVLLQTLRGEEPDTDLDRTKRELASQHASESAGRHLRGPRG
jgi:hypothetical protein